MIQMRVPRVETNGRIRVYANPLPIATKYGHNATKSKYNVEEM